MTRRATIFGGKGFVGSHLAAHLHQRGWEVASLGRGDPAPIPGAHLGCVFYCIGLTADFRSRPFETVEAHVTRLADIVRTYDFESFVYLSSSRVYARSADTDEDAAIPVASAVADDLYNVSKLMGEALCLSSGRQGVRVARLSNVFGGDLVSQNFLTAVVREAVTRGHVELQTAPDSAKDYIAIADVVRALELLATTKTEPVVNVARGRNTTHGEICDRLQALYGIRTTVKPDASTIVFPRISTARLDRIMPGAREDVLDELPRMFESIRAAYRHDALRSALPFSMAR